MFTSTPARTMKAEYVEKQKEYEAKKARAKALKLRLTCIICGTNPKTLLNCPCGTTQCDPAHERVGVGALARDATPQVLLDRVSKNRLARPRPPQGVQEDPKRARGGGGAGRGPGAPAGRDRLRPRSAVPRRRGPRAHRRRTRGRSRAARGEPGAGPCVGPQWVAVPDLLGRMGREFTGGPCHLLLSKSLRFVLEEDRRCAMSSLSGPISEIHVRDPRATSSPRGERGSGSRKFPGLLLPRRRFFPRDRDEFQEGGENFQARSRAREC